MLKAILYPLIALLAVARYALYALLALAVIAVVAVILIPATSSATREIAFDATIEEVWEVYTGHGEQAEWRSDVAEVSVSEDGKSWTETLEAGGLTIRFEVVEETAPTGLVLKTSSPGSFVGSYTARFEATDSGTVGTFTEEATALGAVPKVMRFLFFDQGAFIERYAEEAMREIERRRREAN